MDRLGDLELFVRIVERGGLAAAGRDIGISPASVTERLAALERHYGARLLNRTTRSISLTDEGRLLFEGARHLLTEAEDLDARVRHGVDRLSGPVRISAPIDLGRNVVAPVLDDFMTLHPAVSIDLLLTDANLDLVTEGIDLAVRFGDLGDSSLRARKMAESTRLVVASPAYIRTHGRPRTPADLKDHSCLLMRFGPFIDQVWRFRRGDRTETITVSGNRIANDGELVKTWCVKGLGIAFKSNWDIAEELRSGQLVELLQEFKPPASAIHVVYPGGRNPPKRVRVLSDLLAERFRVPR